MKDLEEVERMAEVIGAAIHEVPKGDTFRYGLLIGKLMAPCWAVGEERSGEMQMHYNYEDWIQTDDFRRKLRSLDDTVET